MFRMYPLPEDPSAPRPPSALADYPKMTEPVTCLLRIYALRAFGLQPNDASGLADPYIEVSVGGKRIHNRKEYLPHSIAPEFGRYLFFLTFPICTSLLSLHIIKTNSGTARISVGGNILGGRPRGGPNARKF